MNSCKSKILLNVQMVCYSQYFYDGLRWEHWLPYCMPFKHIQLKTDSIIPIILCYNIFMCYYTVTKILAKFQWQLVEFNIKKHYEWSRIRACWTESYHWAPYLIRTSCNCRHLCPLTSLISSIGPEFLLIFTCAWTLNQKLYPMIKWRKAMISIFLFC